VSSLYLLDTDTASYLIRSASSVLDARLALQSPGQVFVSAVTRAELLDGIRKMPQAKRLAARVEGFLSSFHSLPWENAAAEAFAEIRTELERSGTPIGVMDTMIAAHAMAAGAVLVTNNTRHFQRVKGLTVENWTIA
jgi:tRNA(fMet)-specific endonuclease VapC